jgi:hypothetical protein
VFSAAVGVRADYGHGFAMGGPGDCLRRKCCGQTAGTIL